MGTPSFKAALYARVSTKEQDPGSQLADLRSFCGRRGWEVFREYVDSGVSGAQDHRPALDDLMEDARKRRFDLVLVWRFDRFARSTRHLVNALAEFRSLGLGFASYSENLDTSSPMGEAMFAIIAAMAQLERDIIRERVAAGMRRAIARGARVGRPRRPLDLARLQELRRRGLSVREIARELKAGATQVHRALKNAAEMPPDLAGRACTKSETSQEIERAHGGGV